MRAGRPTGAQILCTITDEIVAKPSRRRDSQETSFKLVPKMLESWEIPPARTKFLLRTGTPIVISRLEVVPQLSFTFPAI